MEGPLSKWTNMVHGWQYRWFKLDGDVLLYYTSRDKMNKSQQRGCMRLQGAVVGIDGENHSLFTVTVDGKTFHLQGRDERERNQWVKVLESAIRDCSGYNRRPKTKESPLESLSQKVTESEQYLDVIIDQVKELEAARDLASSENRKNIDAILASTNNLLRTVQHAIIFLKMARKKIDSNGNTSGSEEVGKIKESTATSPPSTLKLTEEIADGPTTHASTSSTPDSKDERALKNMKLHPVSYSRNNRNK
ncbi:unnamed protein product [Caenorhabditis auriculariae]|uniref:PH domain-containing protein n=1 Tax=Caenorhabditis auriculariae TaxID=2777116 RepID=A0A8S1H2T8_9PELO|nr:unnamed protein product [Caenorhabditis auriculariae]